jgi:LAS superfamily LD-carboxypeptidase LdcB
MPGFLRFIFKPSGSRTHTSQPRTNTGDFSPTELSPGAKSLSTTEMDELAEKLRSQLAGSGGGSQNRRSRSLRDLLNLSGTRSEEPQHGMTRQSVSDERRRERVTPFPRSSSSGHEHGDDVDHGWEKSPRAPLRESARSSRTDIWDQAYQACGEAVSELGISALRWRDPTS